MKYLLIIQARMSSERLPGKIMREIQGLPIVEITYKRISRSKKLNKVIIATTNNSNDDLLCEYLNKKKIDFFRGDENNVLKRFYSLAKKYEPKNIIRITSDCPLVDYRMLDEMIDYYELKKLDYYSNCWPPTFPDGVDIEIFTYKSLIETFKSAKSKHDKEHVTTYIKKNIKFKKDNYTSDVDFSHLRWTIDEDVDFILVKKIFSHFKNTIFFSWKDVIKLGEKNKDFFNINMKIIRNKKSIKKEIKDLEKLKSLKIMKKS